jgi:hypothetical protein
MMACCGLACARHLVSRVDGNQTIAVLNIKGMKNTQGYDVRGYYAPDSDAIWKSRGMSLAAIEAAKIAKMDLTLELVAKRVAEYDPFGDIELREKLREVLSQSRFLAENPVNLNAAFSYLFWANPDLIWLKP